MENLTELINDMGFESLADWYVNKTIDYMTLKEREETLYEYMLKEYANYSENELVSEITELYGEGWFSDQIIE